MKIIGLCDTNTATGLRLAGLTELYTPAEDVLTIWRELISRDDIAIIFITEDITQKLGKHLKDFRLSNNIPIIVEIPDKSGKKTDHVDFVSHVIKKAVGVEVT